MISKHFALAFAFTVSTPAFSASLERITTDGGLGNISFQHLAINATGDFVGVSNSRVFAGSVADKSVAQIFAAENTSFVLNSSTSFQVDGLGQTTINVSLDVLGTRMALNGQGDFVLASNTRLFVGSARSGEVREVANAGAFADFQAVKINDAGQYVAISSKKIFGGKVSDVAATPLLEEAFGIFDVSELYAYQTTVDAAAGDKRLALNASGKFVAATRSTVYAGDLAAMTVSVLHQERNLGFRHVSLNDQGQITVVADQDVFVGTAN